MKVSLPSNTRRNFGSLYVSILRKWYQEGLTCLRQSLRRNTAGLSLPWALTPQWTDLFATKLAKEYCWFESTLSIDSAMDWPVCDKACEGILLVWVYPELWLGNELTCLQQSLRRNTAGLSPPWAVTRQWTDLFATKLAKGYCWLESTLSIEAAMNWPVCDKACEGILLVWVYPELWLRNELTCLQQSLQRNTAGLSLPWALTRQWTDLFATKLAKEYPWFESTLSWDLAMNWPVCDKACEGIQ